MAEYIERKSLMENIHETVLFTVRENEKLPTAQMRGANKVIDRILRAPAADVVEIRHGEWEIKSEIHQMFDDVEEELYVECPFCKRTFYVPHEFEDEKILKYARENYPYCHCGAKMDGKDGAE